MALGNLLELGFGRPAPSERELARLSGTTFFGTTTRGILRAARHLEIPLEEPRGLSLQELTAAPGPVLLSISTLPTVRHATLLVAVTGDTAHLIDPDYGHEQRSLPWLENVRYGKALVARVERPFPLPPPR